VAKCQVLVCGGGPSGLSAAIGAARAGANTMILERYGCFGGVITTVGMETLGWYRYEGCTNDTEGIGREFERIA
jgi:flavin-dependent dehydrogenase